MDEAAKYMNSSKNEQVKEKKKSKKKKEKKTKRHKRSISELDDSSDEGCTEVNLMKGCEKDDYKDFGKCYAKESKTREGGQIKQKKKSKRKKEKTKKSKRKKSDEDDSSNTDSASSKGQDLEKDKKKQDYSRKTDEMYKDEKSVQRDDWMALPFDFKTVHKQNLQTKTEAELPVSYNPVNNARELNPYWKSTGTGLPPFKKPSNANEDSFQQSEMAGLPKTKSWQKKPTSITTQTYDSILESTSKTIENTQNQDTQQDQSYGHQINALSARILKAEIMGNSELCIKLKEHLEELKSKSDNEKMQFTERAIASYQSSDTVNVNNGRFQKNKRARMDTRRQDERMRTFLADEKYNIKHMFEEEKYKSSADSTREFVNMTKHSLKNLDAVLKEEPRELKFTIESDRTMDDCEHCFDSFKFDKKLLVSFGTRIYLSLPWHIGLQANHCLLMPLQHICASTLLDEDAWDELTSFRRSLVEIFATQGREVLFFEIAKNLKRKKHMKLHCVPISKNEAELAPFYFKKAIDESEHEWSINKQLISLSKKSLRSSIPKGLSYFWINFGMDSGFAHVIEEESKFPENFAQEVIGGMLKLEMNRWRNPRRERDIEQKRKAFNAIWKKPQNMNANI